MAWIYYGSRSTPRVDGKGTVCSIVFDAAPPGQVARVAVPRLLDGRKHRLLEIIADLLSGHPLAEMIGPQELGERLHRLRVPPPPPHPAGPRTVRITGRFRPRLRHP